MFVKIMKYLKFIIKNLGFAKANNIGANKSTGE